VLFADGATDIRIAMIARRSLILAAVVLLGSAVSNHALAADDPVAIIKAIYARVIKGKGDGGGNFVFETKAAKAKSDARTAKGDAGPPGFDPITNSQDPDVKSFKVVSEKSEPNKATVAVTLTAHQGQRKFPADNVVRYDFVREADGWKIDDFRGAVDGEPWSVRQLFVNYLKLFR
jgi:hypothetical protein